MSQRSVLKRTSPFFLTLILLFQIILASVVWGEEVEKAQKKETSFWDVVLLPLNIVEVPVYALKYTTKPLISFVDKHPLVLYWLSGALEKRYSRGLYPVVNFSGIEGLSGGLVLFDNNFLLTQNKLRLGLSYSTHEYQNYQASWGTTKLSSNSLFYNFIIKYSQSPREPFYGLGPETKKTDKTSFNWEKTGIGTTLKKGLSRNLEFRVSLFFTFNNILKGNDPAVYSTTEVFDPSALPGLSTKIKLLTAKSTFVHDWRNSPGNPSGGGLERVTISLSEGIDDNYFRFGQTGLEIERFLEIFRHRVLAFRLLAFHTLVPQNYQVPFFSLNYLGGSENLRGYSRNRFVDKGLLLGSLEYRYPIWSNLDAFFFIDEGQVFSSIPSIQMRLFRDSKGGGFRIYDDSGIILRAQIGFSREQTKIFLDASKLF